MSGRGARSMVGVITALAVLVLSFGFAGSAHAEGSPWVQSDLPDYAPGSTVTLTAGGFEPAEAVRVVVNDDQGKSWSYATDVTADEGGGFSHGFKLPDWFVATYVVTATAASGTAYTSFTDGNITLSIAPSGVTASVQVEKFNRSEDCAGTPNSNATGIYGSGLANVGGGAGSVRLTASAADVSGARPFVSWTYDGTSATTRDICLRAPGGINIDAVATYGPAVPSNVAPVAAGDAYTVDEDTTLDVADPGVLGNDTDADANPLTAVLAAGPDHGSLTLDANGSFSYSPAANYHGADSFSYRANDGTATSSVATVALTVNPVNDAPTLDAIADVTVAEDSGAASVGLTGISAPSFESGQGLTVTATSSNTALLDDPTVTYASPGATGSLSFTPKADQSGTATVTVTVTDNGGTANGGSNSTHRTFQVTVTAVNDAPVAVDDSATTAEDTAVVVDVLANDSDVDGDSISVVPGSLVATNGTATVVASGPDTGKVRFTPDAEYGGPAGFTYRATDGSAQSNTAAVAITVDPVNDAPVAVDDETTVDEDGSVGVDVLANDSDADGDPLEVTEAGPAGHGTVEIDAEGTVTYTPDANFNGADSFGYTVSDGNGGTDTATVSVTVTAANDAPVADDDAASTDEDSPVTIDVLSGDADVDGDTLLVLSVTSGANGTTSVNPDGTVTYTPAADFNGTDAFTYTVVDGLGGEDTATVTVTVAAVNDAPLAVDDEAAVDEDGSVGVDVLANDSDVDGDSLTVSEAGQGEHGSTVVGTDGSVTYTPEANFNGTDSFGYTVSDGNGGTDTATVLVTVNPVNDAPTAEDQTVTTDEDTPVDVTIAGADIDGDALLFSVTGLPQHGTLHDGTHEITAGDLVAGSGSYDTGNPVTYVPVSNFHGADSFAFRSSDGTVSSGEATVSLTVTPVNDAPLAEDDSATTAEDAAAGGNVLGNDSDVDGDSLSAVLADQAEHGTATVDADGAWSYTPDADFVGTDSFTYTVCDDHASTPGDATDQLCDTGTVTVTVSPVNDAPTLDLIGDVAVDEDSGSTTVDLAGITVGPANEYGQVLTVSASSDNTALLEDPAVTYTSPWATGSLSVTPKPDQYGTAHVTVTVSDDGGTADSGVDTTVRTFTVTVTPVNDAPVAAGDAATTAEDTATSGNVLGNDSDVDGDSLSASLDDQAEHGTATVDPDGSWSYTPEADYFGTDSFTYQVCDDHATTPADDQLCDTGTVDITVTPVNDAPVVTGGADRTTTEGAAVTVDATFGDVDRAAGEVYTATVDWGDGSPVESAAVSGSSVSASHTYADDENPGDDVYHATITVTDAGTTDGAAHPLAGSDTVDVGVSNVAPSVEAPTVAIDPVTGVASLATTFSDPAGSHDAPYTGSFTVDGEAVPGTVSGSAMTASTKLAPGCHTFGTTASVTDDDGGTGTSGTTVTSGADVYAASFQAPIKDNVRNIAKYGNVVPVKVQLASSCNAGTNVTDVPLYLTIAQGGDAILDDSVSDSSVVVQSVSNADSGTRMRVAGDGYIYNLATKGTGWVPGNDYTLRVRAGSAGGPIILRALFQPKK